MTIGILFDFQGRGLLFFTTLNLCLHSYYFFDFCLIHHNFLVFVATVEQDWDGEDEDYSHYEEDE